MWFPLLSLRRQARQEVRAHIASNPEIGIYRNRLHTRLVVRLFRGRSATWFIGIYILLLSSVIAVSGSIADYVTALNGDVTRPYFLFGPSNVPTIIDASVDLNRILLAVQATLLAVILPVAIALVTLANNQRSASINNAFSRAYFIESGCYELGRSSVVMLTGSIFILFWPFSQPLQDEGIATCSGCVFGTLMTFVHALWLSLNVIGLWHFLRTSLDFVRPEGQRNFIRRFEANSARREWLENELTRLRYSYPSASDLLTNDEVGTEEDSAHIVYFDRASNVGAPVVMLQLKNTSVLYDVWFRPLRWVVRRWVSRTKVENNPTSSHTLYAKAILNFPLGMGRSYSGTQILCRQRNGVELSGFERWVVRHCFRFRRSSE